MGVRGRHRERGVQRGEAGAQRCSGCLPLLPPLPSEPELGGADDPPDSGREDGRDLRHRRGPLPGPLGSAPEKGTGPGRLYDRICHTVFHAPTSGGLEIRRIRGKEGEIGLRAVGADQYFGVVYVGDAARLLKLAREETPGLVGPEEVIADPLFSTINTRESPITVLVGARRFMEGWNSWRVSSMGLLNIGRTEGSQIIQLFGRGVRLRGRDFSMKRSRALPGGNHPRDLPLLETLNIFAVRASYMAKFREYLAAEGVAEPVRLPLPLHLRTEHLDKGLVVPRLDTKTPFADAAAAFAPAPGSKETGIRVELNLTSRFRTMQSGGPDLLTEATATPESPGRFPRTASISWSGSRSGSISWTTPGRTATAAPSSRGPTFGKSRPGAAFSRQHRARWNRRASATASACRAP